MQFICNSCNYTAHTKFNLNKHLGTKKHIEKVQEQQVESRLNLGCIQNKPINNNYVCVFCDKQYSTAGNLAKHKKTCNDKEILETNYKEELSKLKNINNELIIKLNEQINISHQKDETILQKDETISVLKSEVTHLKMIVNNSGSMIKTSLSTMAYVLKHYKDAPVLESPKDYSAIHYEQDNTEFIENLIYEHNNNKLHVYISDFIIKTYKTDDPSKQSFWNSDTSRLTYLIREIIANNKVDWRVDKKGIKITKFVIEPILEYIENLVRDYVQNFKVNRNHSAKEAERIMMKMKSGNDILSSIETKILSEEILKYITPHFYIIKNDELIEE